MVIDAAPILDEQGKILAVVETVRDITEQKQAQDALDDQILCPHLADAQGPLLQGWQGHPRVTGERPIATGVRVHVSRAESSARAPAIPATDR